MTPRTDECEQDNNNLNATDDDDSDDDSDDDGLKEDMAAVARACKFKVDEIPSEEDPLLASVDEIPYEKDPLLASGDAIVPFTGTVDSDSDVQSDLECLNRVKSLCLHIDSIPQLPPMAAASDDDEDDMETVRAIFKRFSAYDKGGWEAWSEEDQTTSLIAEKDVAESSISDRLDAGETCPDSQCLDNDTNLLIDTCDFDVTCEKNAGEMCPDSKCLDNDTNLLIDTCGFDDTSEKDAGEMCPDSKCLDNDTNLLIDTCSFDETYEKDAGLASQILNKSSRFPPSAQAFVDALSKNRALQQFLRSKLIEIEAKIEVNNKLREKVKILKDFQVSCNRRTGSALSMKKDPRVQLISSKKSFATKKSKNNNKKVSAMRYGPDENSRVANYKMVLERFPLSLDRKKWSNKEREGLSKGIKQQFQETVYQISVDRMGSECSPSDIIDSFKDLEITPVRIRAFLPKVKWDPLASMHVTGRTGAECESRWLNCEDPLINHGSWTGEEDRSLLIIVQETGIRNWFDIAASLATNRTPFQCLARYQRSLNSSMINSEWTEEEDVQLCSAVAYFGESNWQSVASVLERRTGTQCSNRWKKSICPVRKGSFTPEEDERLTVAVALFGRKWNQIAKYVPGRIQSQCRERYLNSLDPSLKWGGWTEEEDLRLEAAITKYGYCWSKVAEDVPPRTDSQCRKRWKVICPEQVPLLQEARKRQRSLLARNFVDRESERPALTLNDFIPLQMLVPPSDVDAEKLQKKRKRKSRGICKEEKSKKHGKETELCTVEARGADPKKERPKRHAKKKSFYPEDVEDIVPKKEKPKRHSKKARICPEEVQYITAYNDRVKTSGGGVPFSAPSEVPKKMRSKRGPKKAQLKEVDNIACSDEVKTFAKKSESQDEDNITLACFLRNKSKKKLSQCTKNASHGLSSSRKKTVSKQVENQFPSGEQDRLSLSCGIGGTKDLLMQTEDDSRRQVRKPEGTNATRKSEDVHSLYGDGNAIPLKFYVRKKTKKWSQVTEGSHACSPSILIKGSTLLHGNKPTVISNNSEPSMSKVVEQETVLTGGVAEAEQDKTRQGDGKDSTIFGNEVVS
ncbi:unnamed protein product [Lathyrus sativus]|nr:unnamed protein product [Lathyrus sativus]